MKFSWIFLVSSISIASFTVDFLAIKTDVDPWQSWGPCSASCGATGTRTRKRTCHNVIVILDISNKCLINGTQTESCIGDCPLSTNIQTTTTKTTATAKTTVTPVDLLAIKTDVDPWQSWGPCSASCGATGTRTRKRTCHNVLVIIDISNKCLINGTQTESCIGDCPLTSPPNIQTTTTQTTTDKTTVLPVIDHWSTWHGSSKCSVSCGGGFRTRSRSCHHHHSCEGSSIRTESCNTQPCPVDGGWSSWQSTAQCSVTCGGGVIKRTRTCNYPPPANGGYQCQGKSLKSEHCNTNPCPVNGVWSSWQNPSQCTVTCGGGLRVRIRSCTSPTPANGGQQCVGSFFESESCNTHPCPASTTTTTTMPSPTTTNTTQSTTTTTKPTTFFLQPPTIPITSLSPPTTTSTLTPPTTTTTPQPTTTTTATPPTSSTTKKPPQTTTKSTPTTTRKKFFTIRAVFK